MLYAMADIANRWYVHGLKGDVMKCEIHGSTFFDTSGKLGYFWLKNYDLRYVKYDICVAIINLQSLI